MKRMLWFTDQLDKPLSVASASAGAGAEEDEMTNKEPGQSMEVDGVPEHISPAPPVAEKSRPKGKGKAKDVIIIEELDTPATRREKTIKKKAERAARLAAEAAAAAQAVEDEQGSDLSSLSEGERADPDGRSVKRRKSMNSNRSQSQLSVGVAHSRKGKRVVDLDVEPGAIILGPGEKLESGTLGLSIDFFSR
jgi:hypothetical protein